MTKFRTITTGLLIALLAVCGSATAGIGASGGVGIASQGDADNAWPSGHAVVAAGGASVNDASASAMATASATANLDDDGDLDASAEASVSAEVVVAEPDNEGSVDGDVGATADPRTTSGEDGANASAHVRGGGVGADPQTSDETVADAAAKAEASAEASTRDANVSMWAWIGARLQAVVDMIVDVAVAISVDEVADVGGGAPSADVAGRASAIVGDVAPDVGRTAGGRSSLDAATDDVEAHVEAAGDLLASLS